MEATLRGAAHALGHGLAHDDTTFHVLEAHYTVAEAATLYKADLLATNRDLNVQWLVLCGGCRHHAMLPADVLRQGPCVLPVPDFALSALGPLQLVRPDAAVVLPWQAPWCSSCRPASQC